MAFRDAWYPHALDALRSLRGDGPLSADGSRLPLITALDTLAILTQLSGPLVDAIERFQRSQSGDLGGRVVQSRILKDGALTLGGGVIGNQVALSLSAPVRDYVAGYGVDGAEWRRYLTPETEAATYEVWIPDDASEPELLRMIRAAVRQWQRAIQVSADCLVIYGANLERGMALDQLDAFWTAVRKLCSELDTIGANPPTSTTDKIVGATKAALDASAYVAGQAVAVTAETAGRTAAQVASGFFDQAGSTTLLLVAGLAVFLIVH